MSYGLSTFMINENFKSLSLQRKGRANFSNKITQINVAQNEIAVIQLSDGQVCLLSQENGIATIATETASFVDFLIFSTNVPKSGGYGIEVYNTRGDVVFSSNHKFLRPISSVDLNVSKGVFQFVGENNKQYGVVLSNFGFNFAINYNNGYSDSRSVRVSGNTIEFGFCKYYYSGLYKTGMTYNSHAMFFNALVVDVTGY
ncbi:DUF6453 family protein [Actinobacillus pleuropneumoniae]|uniref:DUF6453 family protein n=2 Tax=Actinobacillus pleuropneumoniae TaxID=715 RepID=A0A9Q4DGK6_ACTPL|nr:DUF6453 family protein [Actinobacillus pleuropneumoniae]EFL79781.1 hypothetical protein APP6_0804 [Actinobacillus pleuropneumoniae serovar 6 str. Femo]EFM92394.1 hypothetical protein appser6_5980 [Actinobacillus pleuropneumoniae serovar 6 str. Femo]KIE87651.1 hypothetical protein AP1022_02519 [Actinobacillus pleuropneumoniae]KIE92251.1 hypothetical protein AP518_00625 [Actinobacillus pleuropneumoniae]KIE97486.1 hypothetical protein AP5651_00627 [Actinobacillus pleuropneumoniae]